MSKETLHDLNNLTLIGCTDQRGKAWHYRADEQGDESNHYPGPIPVGDVTRRLFNWQPLKVQMKAVVPCDLTANFDGFDDEGKPYLYVPMPGRVAILRSDTNYTLGVFKEDYEPHEYNEWLIGLASNVLGDSLVISSAGLIRNGGVAWVEVSLPETMHDPRSGFDYRPNFLTGTSLDGSLSTTGKATITSTVCDNTFESAMAEVGGQFKIRHTKYSKLNISDARKALGLIEQTADEFQAELDTLVETTVTDTQWFKFLDEYVPIAEDAKDATIKRAQKKRDELTNLYRNDVRCADWTGTGLGVVQTANTYLHHVQEVRGAGRSVRNAERALLAKPGEIDGGAIAALAKVTSNETLLAAV